MTSTRRSFLANGALAAIGTATLPSQMQAASSTLFHALPQAFATLEAANAARLGVAILDTATGEQSGHRATERFAMCSTFKMMLASAVLERVDHNRERLDRAIAIPAKPLVNYSPLTEPHAGGHMTVSDLCFAILTRSDNTAANLLLETIGGPAGFTRFARSLGDPTTRLDRTETTLNDATPGDPRDTTSPNAMLANMRKLLLGDTLSAASRDQLIQWMIVNTTGDASLRAHLPPTWRAGDKTGSNGETTTNDIAILWPPHRAPILITAYVTDCPGLESKRKAILAEVGRLAIASIPLA